MMRVDGESKLSQSRFGQSGEKNIRRLDHLAARLTNEVAMRRTCQVIGRRTVSQVRVHDDTESFQLFEISIDGGQMDVGRLRLHRGGQFLGSVVS